MITVAQPLLFLVMGHLPVWAYPIVNGETEEGFPSVVSLGAEFNGQILSLCSGNIITPRMILTAAHCGAGVPIEGIVTYGRAFVGTDVQNAEHVLEFSDAYIHPDYEPLESGLGGSLGSHDFGMMVLAEDSPVAPTWFRDTPLEEAEAIGTTVTSVGFGVTSSAGYGSGTKRSADLVVDELEEMFLISYSRTNADSANICSGDSGGPQFFITEDGEAIQWAVHSWGDQGCSTSSGSTRVDLVNDWMLELIEDVHATTDRCEIMGNYGDGVCDEFCVSHDPDCVLPAVLQVGMCGTVSGRSSPVWLLALVALGLVRRSELG